MRLARAPALAFDDAKYPDWKGQWVRIGGGAFDPTKPIGRGQQPPLTPEYQAIWEANLAAAKSGMQNYNPQARCMPGGMPRMMVAFEPLEIIVAPEITYMHLDLPQRRPPHLHRRPHLAEGRASRPSRAIRSATGSTTTATAATTRLRSRPAASEARAHFDASGMPLHKDNQTVVKERI